VNKIKGIRTLGTYTAGSFDIWRLAGRTKASCRQHVMADLLEVPKVPQSKSGVTAIRKQAYAVANEYGAEIDSDHPAGREKQFISFCKIVTEYHSADISDDEIPYLSDEGLAEIGM
jgi:hypothetical protein